MRKRFKSVIFFYPERLSLKSTEWNLLSDWKSDRLLELQVQTSCSWSTPSRGCWELVLLFFFHSFFFTRRVWRSSFSFWIWFQLFIKMLFICFYTELNVRVTRLHFSSFYGKHRLKKLFPRQRLETWLNSVSPSDSLIGPFMMKMDMWFISLLLVRRHYM